MDFLWDGTWIEKPDGWIAPDTPAELIAQLSLRAKLRANRHVVQLMILPVGLLGLYHGSKRDRVTSGRAPVFLARQTIRTIAGLFGFLGPSGRFVAMRPGESVVAGLARAFGIEPTPNVLHALNAALVLDVDNELTSSTFGARIAATGAGDLHARICAALNTHCSHLTRSRAESVEELFEPRADSSKILASVRKVLAWAQRAPGFNHPAYPNGDPRAAMLVKIACAIGRSKRRVRNPTEMIALAQAKYGLRPSFELGSVMLCRALGLPPPTASGLRSQARSAGWVAHIFEQRLAAFQIRPPAKYFGLGNST